MGLIDLRTDLKSLRYGNDQRGGGSSNQPYITTPIPEGFAPTSADFLLRNGYLNPVNSFQDVKRLSKFFTDTKTPSGLLFTIKQQLLERQNPKLVNINRIYNPLGTLSQAGLNSLGFHVNKQGLNNSEPSYFNGGRYGYYYATKGLGTNPQSQLLQGEGYENRLTIAYTAKIEKKPLGSLSINPFGVTNLAGNGILLSYPGGPNAPLGLGLTNIRIQNSTRTVDLPKDRTTFGLRLGGTDIANKNYLTYTGAPTINWVYGIENGVSDTYYDLDNIPSNYQFKLTGTVANGLVNRDTSVNKPSISKDNTFAKNLTLDKSNPKYLAPEKIEPSHINWEYNILTSGASSEYFALDSTPDVYINKLRSNNGSSLLNRTEEESKTTDLSNNVYTFNQSQIAKSTSAGQDQNTGFATNVKDFRSGSFGSGKIVSTNYQAFNRENKDGIGLEGYGTSKTSFKGNYIPNGPNQGRVLNPNVVISNDQFEVGKNGEDIIDFNFRILNPADTSNNRLIDFRAYLESWSDGVKSDYTSVKYMGRAESFYKYNGFSRDASVEFLVPALSRGDMIANYRKVNMMMWAVAPNYSDIGLMRGNVVEVTMGNYFRSMPSIIKSVDVVEVEGMGWDINRTTEGKNIDIPKPYASGNNKKGGNVDPKDLATEAGSFYVGQLPKGLKITVQFTPLHQFTPEYGQAFIGQNSIYAGPKFDNSTSIEDATGAAKNKLSVFFDANERNYFGASPYNPPSL